MDMAVLFYILFLCFIQLGSAFYFVTWDELHRVSSVDEFHDQVVRIMREFACEDCREHFSELVKTHPFPLDKVTTLDEAKIWYWLSHNIINTRLEKEWAPYTVLEQYKNTCP